MRKQLVLGACCLFFAVGAASTDPLPRLSYADLFQWTAPQQRTQTAAYRPCRGPEDDRCIQLPRSRRAVAERQVVRDREEAPKLRYARVIDAAPLFTVRGRGVSAPAMGGPLEPLPGSGPNRPRDPIGL